MDDDKLDLIWGAEAIAEFINRTPQQTYHMLYKGVIPGRRVGERQPFRHLCHMEDDDKARRVGQGWVVSRRDLIAFFHVNGEPTVSLFDEKTLSN